MKVSVIIPVYNQKKEIFEQAIKSVINQTIKPYEIIVIDDGSDKLMIEGFASSTDIKIITNEKNMGIGYSRQRGVEAATGDYIAFISSDDIWDERFLETMMKTAKQQPGKILYSNYYMINENSEIIGGTQNMINYNYEDFCIACFEAAYRNTMFVNFSTTFFPKEVFEKCKFKYRFGEDIYFLLISMKHFEYHLVPEYLLKYRVGDNLTSKVWDKIGENNKKIMKEVKEYWNE